MGITGLLPLVKGACIDQVHLSDLSNTVAVIDTYCWLHRALVGAAYDVYKGNSVTAHVDFCFKKIDELKKYNIKPIFVFDGRNLPAKKDTEEIRRANRKKAKEELDKLFAKGDTKTAYKILPRAIDISQEMAKQLIDRLIEAEIDYIVAPYEADAQIAYLIRNGFAHFAISEDSDLILYGCDYVFYKLSSEGNGVLYRNDQVLNCLGEDAYRFNFDKFKRMCILSGCDYLPNLPGIGLMKAKKFFSKLNCNDNVEKELEKLPTILNMKKLTVPKEYIKKFTEAENVFNHQLIYCPREKKLKPFSDYNENHVKEQLDYAGSYLDDDQALNLVLGNVNFSDMKIYDDSLIEKLEKKYFNSPNSIWNKSYEPVDRKIFEEIIEKQLNSNYEMPEELLSVHKRKYNDGKNSESNEFTEIIDKKKMKKSTSFVNSSLAYSEDEEVIVESSFKSTNTSITSFRSENTSIKAEANSSSVKVEVKSRFFVQSNNGEKSPSDLERIKKNKEAIRESLKKLYPSKETSSQPSTQDSGFCSFNSQQSQ